MMRWIVLSVVTLASIVVACATAPQATTPAAADAAAPTSAPTAPTGAAAVAAPDAPIFTAPQRFELLPDDSKGPYMKQIVMPRMAELFQQHDPKDFAEVRCKTCHGDVKKHGFEMPAPELPPLDVTDNFAAERAKHPETMKFMETVVVPEMAKLLGEAPYDPATQKGFGCFECHTKK